MGPQDHRSIQGTGPPVIVLGTDLTGLGVQRSLGAAGIKTLLVDNTPGMARRSRWARNSVLEQAESPDPGPLEAFLRELPVERAVLIACSDNWATAVSSLPETLSERFPTSMPSRSTVSLLADKAAFAGLLERLEVQHPWTKVISTARDLDDVPDSRWSSIFLKPVDSQSFCQLFGVKAFSVTDRTQAYERLRQMHDAGLDAIAQEYIPGPPDQHYFIDGFVDRSGRVRGMLSRRRTRMFPTDYGNSTFMATVPLATVPDAVEGLERLFEGTSYRGIFSAEFKHDPRDGQFRLLEVNVRPWWYVEFTTRCGVNVCELAYLDALGLPVPERVSFPTGERCRLMPDDFYAYLHLRRSSDLTFRAWTREVWGAYDAIFRWDDPLPAFEPVFGFPRRVVRKVRKTFAQSGRGGESD